MHVVSSLKVCLTTRRAFIAIILLVSFTNPFFFYPSSSPHLIYIITAGTSVVANEDGRPSLTRLGAICEQVAELHRRGVEVISKYQFMCI